MLLLHELVRDKSGPALCTKFLKGGVRIRALPTQEEAGLTHAVSACAFCTMATGTLNLPELFYGYFFVFLLSLNPIHCQQFSISFSEPLNCGVQHYFDVSNLTCVKCGPNQVSSKSGKAC